MTLLIIDLLILSFNTLTMVSWNRDWKHVLVLTGLSGTEAGNNADSDTLTI